MAQIVLRIYKRYTLTITQICAPTSSHDDEEVDRFYQQLNDKIDQRNNINTASSWRTLMQKWAKDHSDKKDVWVRMDWAKEMTEDN